MLTDATAVVAICRADAGGAENLIFRNLSKQNNINLTDATAVVCRTDAGGEEEGPQDTEGILG